MKIERKITNKRYSREKRAKEDIKYIVVQSIEDGKLSHYRIINGKAIQFIPDIEISDSVNGARLTTFGYLHGICNQYNSISIGLADDLSSEDIQICFNLIMTLKQRYRIDKGNIVRQKDVTGMVNPKIWWTDQDWENDIKSKLIDIS